MLRNRRAGSFPKEHAETLDHPPSQHHGRSEKEKACPGLQDTTPWHPEVYNLKRDIPLASFKCSR